MISILGIVVGRRICHPLAFWIPNTNQGMLLLEIVIFASLEGQKVGQLLQKGASDWASPFQTTSRL